MLAEVSRRPLERVSLPDHGRVNPRAPLSICAPDPALYAGSLSRGCSSSFDEGVVEVGSVGLVMGAGVVSLAE